MITECAVYAGLAASAGLGRASIRGVIGAGPGGTWHLAVAAMVLLAVRRMTDLCYERATERTGGRIRLPRSARWRRAERSLALPAGERVVLLILTAAIWGPRVAFLALLGWGMAAAGYVLTARIFGMSDTVEAVYGLRADPSVPGWADQAAVSIDGPADPAGPADLTGLGGLAGLGGLGVRSEAAGSAGSAAPVAGPAGPAGPVASAAASAEAPANRTAAGDGIAAYRDDGPLSLWLGRLVEGRLPPLPPAIVGVLVLSALAALGMGNLSGVLVLTPVEAMLLAGLGSCHPHDGRLDWLVPALLQAGEYVFLAALAFTRLVSPPLVYALLAAVVLRHLDVAYRARHRIAWPAARPDSYPARGHGAAGRLTRPAGRRPRWPYPAGSRTDPAGSRTDPVGERTDPVGERTDPVGERTDPVGERTDPVGGQAGAAAGRRRPGDSAGLGWELRMLVIGLGAAFGIVPGVCALLAGYLWALEAREFFTGWLGISDEAA
jgi:hypothetical protein